jgi:transcriptional regulator with XRE-family HTH domain
MARKKSPHPITLRRKALGLSGAAAAKAVGITPSHLRDIETGRVSQPRVDLALRIADVLGVDIRELFRRAA